MIPLITVEGPTASGKSNFAFQLAKELNTDIISADSRQIYKYLDIGTAKPSVSQRKEIRHHLISIIEPDKRFSAGDFVNESEKIIEKIYPNKIPIIVGGTGFYIKTLIDGLFFEEVSDEILRSKLEKKRLELGNDFLYDQLKKLDPVSAENIHKNDSYRVFRALYIAMKHGTTRTTLKELNKPQKKFKTLRFLLNPKRDILYRKINDRVDEMINKGLLEEIEAVLKKGYSWNDPGMNSVGYKDFKGFFLNRDHLKDYIEKVKQHTRNYAKRQFTWYNKIDFDYIFRPEEIDYSKILKKIKFFLEI